LVFRCYFVLSVGLSHTSVTRFSPQSPLARPYRLVRLNTMATPVKWLPPLRSSPSPGSIAPIPGFCYPPPPVPSPSRPATIPHVQSIRSPLFPARRAPSFVLPSASGRPFSFPRPPFLLSRPPALSCRSFLTLIQPRKVPFLKSAPKTTDGNFSFPLHNDPSFLRCLVLPKKASRRSTASPFGRAQPLPSPNEVGVPHLDGPAMLPVAQSRLNDSLLIRPPTNLSNRICSFVRPFLIPPFTRSCQ